VTAGVPRAQQGGDPQRLLRSETRAAELLKAYARRSTPGDRDCVAAWYRLRARLEPGADRGLWSPFARWRRACSWSRVLTLAAAFVLVVKLVPLRARPDAAGPSSVPVRALDAGARGGAGMEGAGGMEGAAGG